MGSRFPLVQRSVGQALEIVRFAIDSLRYSLGGRWSVIIVLVFVLTLAGAVRIVEFMTP